MRDQVRALLARLPSVTHRPKLSLVLDAAAHALDQTSLPEYNRLLSQIEPRAPRGRSGRELLLDHRPTHRLVGYYTPIELAPVEFARLLLLELHLARSFWETRTLWLALERGETSLGDQAGIATLIACIEAELELTPEADMEGACRSLILQLKLPLGRARELVAAGLEYERVRANHRGGPERTERMSELFTLVGSQLAEATNSSEVKALFDAARDGQRMVALALMARGPAVWVVACLEEAIMRPRSPFEQYSALCVVDVQLSAMPQEERAKLRTAIEQARSHGFITPENRARWSLSNRVLERLEVDSDSARGIDVRHQLGIDWDKVTASGVSFSFVKATEGLALIDQTFVRHWAMAEQAGVLRGAYHVFHPSLDAVGQARIFLAQLGDPGELPPVVDVEVSDGVEPAKIVTGLTTWIDEITSALGRPIVHTNAAFWSTLPGTNALAVRSDLWIANWNDRPHTIDGWATWTFWQYSNDVTVPGSSGSVRGNRFNGTLADLRAYSAARRALPPRASRWDGRFLSELEVRAWLRNAGHLGGAQILDAILLFSTLKQQTWFISSPLKVICLLDDANTRKARRLVQFTVSPNDLLPVSASRGTSSRASGTLGIGKRRYLYSTSLFPNPKDLVTNVTDFIQRAAAANSDLLLSTGMAPSTVETADRELAALVVEGADQYYRRRYEEYISVKREDGEHVPITFEAFVGQLRADESETTQKSR